MKSKFALSILLLFSFLVAFAQVDDIEDDFDNSESEVDTLSFRENSGCIRIDSIVNFALTHRTKNYKYGSAGPNYFDCSGLMFYSFHNFGIALGRSSRDQFLKGKAVEKNEIQRGDLVFYSRGKYEIGHVGLVVDVDSIGNYFFVHASNAKNGIRVDCSKSENYIRRFVGAKRILDCDGNYWGSDSLYYTSQTFIEIAKKINNATPEQIFYTVKKGDTLTKIAKKYKCSIDQLKKWNKLKSDFIREGQKLRVSKSA